MNDQGQGGMCEAKSSKVEAMGEAILAFKHLMDDLTSLVLDMENGVGAPCQSPACTPSACGYVFGLALRGLFEVVRGGQFFLQNLLDRMPQKRPHCIITIARTSLQQTNKCAIFLLQVSHVPSPFVIPVMNQRWYYRLTFQFYQFYRKLRTLSVSQYVMKMLA